MEIVSTTVVPIVTFLAICIMAIFAIVIITLICLGIHDTIMQRKEAK